MRGQASSMPGEPSRVSGRVTACEVTRLLTALGSPRRLSSIASDPTQGMGEHGFPRQLLQQPVQLLLLVAEFRLLENFRSRQANRIAPIDHGEVAVAYESLEGRGTVTGSVGEQVRLILQSRCLPRDDFLTQRQHGL